MPVARVLSILALIPVAAAFAFEAATVVRADPTEAATRRVQIRLPAPAELPAGATVRLAESLTAAEAHRIHLWRDTPPFNEDGTLTAYVEIPRGDRQKWEFRMPRNAREIDRVLPAALGGYPVNYGFVPQTISYDGDPFDVLVLGPPLPGGTLVRGVIMGVMFMEDEKGLDSKVVISPPGPDGRPREALTADEQQRIGEFFSHYKDHEPGAYSRVPGWGSVHDAVAYVQTTHAFFRECRERAGRACALDYRFSEKP